MPIYQNLHSTLTGDVSLHTQLEFAKAETILNQVHLMGNLNDSQTNQAIAFVSANSTGRLVAAVGCELSFAACLRSWSSVSLMVPN